MTERNDQSQKVAANAIAIQAAGDVHFGVSATEARQIAADVCTIEWMRLSGGARQVAEERAAKVREEFFEKLAKENPEGVKQAADVDFQHGLFAMQRDFARTGDANLGSLLVDLLVARSKETERNLKQIVLNEALATAPKLTASQIAALGLIFIFRYSMGNLVNRPEKVAEYFDQFVRPLVEGLSKNTSFQHLEFASCGAIGVMTLSLEDTLRKQYSGVFTHGFEPQELTRRGFQIVDPNQMFMPCMRNPRHLQLRANNREVLEEMLQQQDLQQHPDAQKFRDLIEVGLMSAEEIRAEIIEQRPYMESVFDLWTKTSMKNFTLTTVGIAIGHASVARYAGAFADLGIWMGTD